MAFMFYNWYVRTKGFSCRKDKVVKNCRGEIKQQTFVCHRRGYIMKIIKIIFVKEKQSLNLGVVVM